MSINNLPPSISSGQLQQPCNTPPAKADHPPLQQATIALLANTACKTAADSTFTEKEIIVVEKNPDSGLISGVMSYVGSFFSKASNLAQDFVVSAIVPLNVYDDKIADAKQSLFKKTGSHVAYETAKVIAQRQIHKFSYFLNNYSKLTVEEAQTGSLKQYLTITDGVVSLSAKGRLFLSALNGGATGILIQQTFELNILKAMSNGISYLQKLPKKNPLFFVDLVQETITHVTKEFTNPEQTTEKTAADEHAKFLSSLQDNILDVLFPGGADDIEIPLPFKSFFSKQAFLKIQEKSLPRKIAIFYDRATSDVTKYRVLKKVAVELEALLTKSPEPKSNEPTATKHSNFTVSKKQQEAFDAAITKLASLCIDELDDKLLKALKPVILAAIKKKGPLIVEKLLSLDINSLLNKNLQGLCQKLSPKGEWTQIDGRDVFHFVASDPKTRTERAVLEQAELQKNQAKLAETVGKLGKDLDGLINRIAAVKTSSTQNIDLHSKKRIHKLRKWLSALHLKVRIGFTRFALNLFGVDKRINALTKKAMTLSQKIDLHKVAKPLKKVVLKKK